MTKVSWDAYNAACYEYWQLKNTPLRLGQYLCNKFGISGEESADIFYSRDQTFVMFTFEERYISDED